MATYVLREGDSYYITKSPVHEEGYWDWTPWLSRGVYMEGIRRLRAKGLSLYGFMLPDDREIVKAYYMISYRSDIELTNIEYLLRITGLDRICRLEYVDEEEDKSTLIFYLLP
jgi:hypothetical protein